MNEQLFPTTGCAILFQMTAPPDSVVAATNKQIEQHAELFKRLLKTHGYGSDAVSAGLLDTLMFIRRRISEDPAVYDRVKPLLDDTERLQEFIIEMARRSDDRATAFQIRMSTEMLEATKMRVSAFTASAAHLEKLSILGIGYFGLSISLFGFVAARVPQGAQIHDMPFAFLTWAFILVAVYIATLGQLQFSRMTHELLHLQADDIFDKNIKESALIYNQSPEPELPSTAKRPRQPLGSRSSIYTQSSKMARNAIWATIFLVLSFSSLFLFIIGNAHLLAASGLVK